MAGKLVVVTGASGGIGAACARAFSAEGARVVIHWYRGRERAELLGRELGALTVQADLTAPEEVDKLFEEIRRAEGPPDVCIATAGIRAAEDSLLWHVSDERWRTVLEGNLTATFLTARGFLREVEATGHGSLVLIGSTAALFGEAGHADYAAAKAAIVFGLLLSLKNEIVRVAPRGRVNVVCPGWTNSPTRANLLDASLVARATRTDGSSPHGRARGRRASGGCSRLGHALSTRHRPSSHRRRGDGRTCRS